MDSHHLVPQRATFRLLVGGQSHVVGRHHRAAREVPERHADAGTWIGRSSMHSVQNPAGFRVCSDNSPWYGFTSECSRFMYADSSSGDWACVPTATRTAASRPMACWVVNIVRVRGCCKLTVLRFFVRLYRADWLIYLHSLVWCVQSRTQVFTNAHTCTMQEAEEREPSQRKKGHTQTRRDRLGLG